MEEVVLSFGMVVFVVVYTYSRLRGAFEAMGKLPQITFWHLTHINHKVNSIKNYYRFLKQKQAIES